MSVDLSLQGRSELLHHTDNLVHSNHDYWDQILSIYHYQQTPVVYDGDFLPKVIKQFWGDLEELF